MEIRNSLEFWIRRCGFRIPGTRFKILCQGNRDSGFLKKNLLHSGFHEQKCPKFRNPDYFTCSYFWKGVWDMETDLGVKGCAYLKKDTEDGQTIRMRQWREDVWVFSVIADKMNLQIEMSSLVISREGVFSCLSTTPQLKLWTIFS